METNFGCRENNKKVSEGNDNIQVLTNSNLVEDSSCYNADSKLYTSKERNEHDKRSLKVKNGYNVDNNTNKNVNSFTVDDNVDKMGTVKGFTNMPNGLVHKRINKCNNDTIMYKSIDSLGEKVNVVQKINMDNLTDNERTITYPSKCSSILKCNFSPKCVKSIEPSNVSDISCNLCPKSSFEDSMFSKDPLYNASCKKPYSRSFFNDPIVQEQLFQENLRAQYLLNKYFINNEPDVCLEPLLNNEIETQALTLIKNVSEMLNRYKNFNSSTEIFLGNHKRYKKASSKYYSFQASNYKKSNKISNPEMVSSQSEFKSFEDFPKGSLNNSCSNYQFIDTNSLYSNEGVLFRNNSSNLEKDISAEQFLPLMQELRVKKRSSFTYVDSNPKLLMHPSIQQCSGDQPHFDDFEYKKWLKHKDWIKYTDMTATESTCSDRIVSTSSLQPQFRKESVYSHPNTIWHEEKMNSGISSESYSSQLNELVLYEHVVVFNFIYYILLIFRRKGMRKLGLRDRLIQILFFVMCYYVVILLHQTGFGNSIYGINFFSKRK